MRATQSPRQQVGDCLAVGVSQHTVLDSENVQHKIRLQGIDAPEKKQAFGTKSKEALSGKIADQEVVVSWKEMLR